VIVAITHREARQVDEANASGRTPVLFLHGLWSLAWTWDPWLSLFREAGYAPIAADWPGDPETVDDARADPGVFAHRTLGQITEHVAEVIDALDHEPVVIGHSAGALVAQILAGQGRCAASVAIAPAPFRGVLPLPLTALRSVMPVLRDPSNRGRAVVLTPAQFRYAWANVLTDEEAWSLYETHHVAASGAALFQIATGNLNPRSEARVDTLNLERGPLLLLGAERDHTIPRALLHAAFKRQRRNRSVTEVESMPGRGHSLTVDHGWREVAERALRFVNRFV
jgi:pimeloyl-ACP methyl ester carboxylesterase